MDICKQEILNTTYPKLFKNMYFECGDGWFDLLKDFAEEVHADLPEESYASQVKEKYGALRIYMTSATEYVYRTIDRYEKRSKSICEICGNPGKTLKRHGWYRTTCAECMKQEQRLDGFVLSDDIIQRDYQKM